MCQASVIQLLIHVQLFAVPWTAARQVSPSFTIPWSLPKFMSTESNHLILYCPLFLPPVLNLSQPQNLFQRAGPLHWVAKISEHQLQHQYFQ